MSIAIPRQLLPEDGRFGSGPSKVRLAQVEAVAAGALGPLGTSHRQLPVRDLVARIREGLAALFSLPPGYEVVLGNGGSTCFWEVATACLVEQSASLAVFGEFGNKFAQAITRAPFLDDPAVTTAPGGAGVLLSQLTTTTNGHPVDVFGTVQNETSTGVAVPISRVGGSESLLLVDATSAAGALPIDITETDVYYFAPQKAFASDGGLWVAIASPAAIARAARIEEDRPTGRWIPEFLSFTTALNESRNNQTLNTPAVATLIMFAEQVDWLLAHGGLPWAVSRCAESGAIVYNWAESRPWATPFVVDPALRSNSVATIDLEDSIDAAQVVNELRANGIVDVFPYRKLGRNQLRIALFPAIEPDDVAALTRCIDYVVEKTTVRQNG